MQETRDTRPKQQKKKQKTSHAPVELQLAATINVLQQRFLVVKQAMHDKKTDTLNKNN